MCRCVVCLLSITRDEYLLRGCDENTEHLSGFELRKWTCSTSIIAEWLCCVSGWCPTQATVRSGVRWSSYRAFLRRARHRDNLHIFTYATVTKVTPSVSPTQCSEHVLISTLLIVCHIHSASSISNVIIMLLSLADNLWTAVLHGWISGKKR